MKNLYLLELSEVMSGNQVYFPYSTGLLWSYLKTVKQIKNNYKLKKWFFAKQKLDFIVNAIKDPDIIGFSCYVWNWNLNNRIAKAIKKKYPKTLIIYGGQHQPLQDRNDNFFKEYPWVDILVHGEGEDTFKNILLANLKQRRHFKKILGCTIKEKNNNRYITPTRPRIRNLKDYPSPYLDGTFNELLSDKKFNFHATVESVRGCPYKCTFCEIGNLYYNKIQKNYNKTEKEIQWLGKNKIEYTTDCNSNFGLFFNEDFKLVTTIKETIKKHGQMLFRVTWAKGKANELLPIAKILEECNAQKGMTIALQSLNQPTLKAIHRSNITETKLKETINLFEQEGISSYIELILGLPEETLNSFKQNIWKIMEFGYHKHFEIHFLSALPNTPFSDPIYLEKYGIKTVPVQSLFTHINPDINNDFINSEELIIQTNTMPYDDWLKAVQFRWLILFGHYLGPMQYVARFINRQGVSYREFYEHVLNYIHKNPKSLLGKEQNQTINSMLNSIENKKYWGRILDISSITWNYEEASAITIGINWSKFCGELKEILNKWNIDEDILTELINYQTLRFNIPYRQNKKMVFNYNIHEYICENKTIQNKKNTITIKKTKKYNTLDEWAHKTFWYGKKTSTFKTDIIYDNLGNICTFA